MNIVNYIIIIAVVIFVVHPRGIDFLHNIEMKVGLFITQIQWGLQQQIENLKKELKELKEKKL